MVDMDHHLNVAYENVAKDEKYVLVALATKATSAALPKMDMGICHLRVFQE